MSIQDKYNELLNAVSTEYPHHSRHETALKYIQERDGEFSSVVRAAKNLIKELNK